MLDKRTRRLMRKALQFSIVKPIDVKERDKSWRRQRRSRNDDNGGADERREPEVSREILMKAAGSRGRNADASDASDSDSESDNDDADDAMAGAAAAKARRHGDSDDGDDSGGGRPSLLRRPPTFMASKPMGDGTQMYTTSYLRLNRTVSELKGPLGKDFCRKYGINQGALGSTLDYLLKRVVKVNFSPDAPAPLVADGRYVRYSLANKMNPDADDTFAQSHEALMADETCTYMAIDVLFEDPRRTIVKLVESFCNEHTRERKVLLGVADTRAPYCLQAVHMRRVPGRRVRVYNVRHMSREIVGAVNSEVINPSARVDDEITHEPNFEIDEDVETWAYRKHFEHSGYDQSTMHYFLPANTERMLSAVYGVGKSAQSVERYVRMATQKYLVQHGHTNFERADAVGLAEDYVRVLQLMRQARRGDRGAIGPLGDHDTPLPVVPLVRYPEGIPMAGTNNSGHGRIAQRKAKRLRGGAAVDKLTADIASKSHPLCTPASIVRRVGGTGSSVLLPPPPPPPRTGGAQAHIAAQIAQWKVPRRTATALSLPAHPRAASATAAAVAAAAAAAAEATAGTPAATADTVDSLEDYDDDDEVSASISALH